MLRICKTDIMVDSCGRTSAVKGPLPRNIAGDGSFSPNVEAQIGAIFAVDCSFANKTCWVQGSGQSQSPQKQQMSTQLSFTCVENLDERPAATKAVHASADM